MNSKTMLYLNDSYLAEFSATVTGCEKIDNNRFAVTLDQTAFFAEGGGQPCDTGILGGVKVTDVQEKDDTVIHYTDSALEIGKKVTGKIDFARRFDFMQQHTGEHIVSGIVHSRFGYNNVGFHLGADCVTVDFDGVLNAEALELIESTANAAIAADLAVCVYYPSEKQLANTDYRSKKELFGEVRLIGIEGVDLCACCGTHTKSTGEVQLIKIISGESYKGGMRVTLLSGFRAINDYSQKHTAAAKISALLCAKPQDIYSAVHRLHDENARLKNELYAAKTELFSVWAKSAQDTPLPTVIKPGLSPDEVRRLCVMLSEEFPEKICRVFSQNEKGGYFFAVCSQSLDVREECKHLNAECGAKGGGTPRLCQGQAANLPK